MLLETYYNKIIYNLLSKYNKIKILLIYALINAFINLKIIWELCHKYQVKICLQIKSKWQNYYNKHRKNKLDHCLRKLIICQNNWNN